MLLGTKPFQKRGKLLTFQIICQSTYEMTNVSIPNNLITKCQLYRTDQLHNKRGRTKKGHIMIYNKLVQPFAFARFNRKQYPPHVRAFWRVVRLIYLSTRDIMKFIWIVLFSVLEIIKAYKTPLFPYCPIVNHHKSRCVRLKSRMLPGGEKQDHLENLITIR